MPATRILPPPRSRSKLATYSGVQISGASKAVCSLSPTIFRFAQYWSGYRDLPATLSSPSLWKSLGTSSPVFSAEKTRLRCSNPDTSEAVHLLHPPVVASLRLSGCRDLKLTVSVPRLAHSEARLNRASNLGRKPSSWLTHPDNFSLRSILVGMPRFELGSHKFLKEISGEAVHASR